MKIKKGDNVKVIAGKDKGKTGKVIQAFPRLEKVVVENVNMLKKHMRAKQQGQQGQAIEFSAPLSVTNVLLVCPKCAKPTRVGVKRMEDGKKGRVCKKCKEVIE